MAMANAQHLDRIVDYLRQRRDSDVSLADVITLAEITAQSLQSFFATMDAAVYRELREIAEYIAAMKLEIGALQANDLKDKRIPAAGQELSAIVRATEDATHTIMGCAEAVMAADARGDAEVYKALVDEQMLVVFEACSFQDITGQRVAKVVETLQHIEARVSRFATAVRAKDQNGPLSEHERTVAERKRQMFIHGPALEGEGNAQTEIDSLLNGATAKDAGQADIDRLFS